METETSFHALSSAGALKDESHNVAVTTITSKYLIGHPGTTLSIGNITAVITKEEVKSDGTRIVHLENISPHHDYTLTVSMTIKNFTSNFKKVSSNNRQHNESHIRKPIRSKKGFY